MELRNKISCLLNEVLGVPDNVVDLGEHCYNFLLEVISKGGNIDRLEGKYISTGNFSINKFNFTGVAWWR